MSKKTKSTKKDLSKQWKAFWKTLKDDPKKQALYGGAVFAVAVLIALAVMVFAQEDSVIVDFAEDVVSGEVFEDEPTELPRQIDGVVVAAEKANPILACVMIENAAFGGVRPQSGLSQASVVYEIIVEGGITRYMAVFADEEADSLVGPVRSARDTYLEYASELDCSYNHAGGSYTAMVAMPKFGLKNVDALLEPQYFQRVSGKYAPHDLFTTINDLFVSIEEHSWTEEPEYDSWTFEDAPQNSVEEDVNSVVIRFGGSYDSEFVYNEEENAYERINGGVVQSDAETGETLMVSNVIIQRVGDGIPLPNKGRINWVVTGEGDVDIYRSGKRVRGTWKKDDRLSRTMYFDENGEEIQLERGTSWVSIVPPHIGVEETLPESEENVEEGEEVSTSPEDVIE